MRSFKDADGLNYINQYKIIKKLGEGSQGKVFMAQDEAGTRFAVKVITKKIKKQLTIVNIKFKLRNWHQI